jgi:TonB family protein
MLSRNFLAGARAAVAISLTAMATLPLAEPARAAEAAPCSKYALHGVVPGMRPSEVRKKMGGRGDSTDVAPGPFGPATFVTYPTRAAGTILVQYDRDLQKASEARVAGVLVRGGEGAADPASFARMLLETFGEPTAGRDFLDGGLRSGTAVWTDRACDAEVTAFRGESEWWQPGAGQLSVEVRSLRYAEALASWKRTGEALPPGAAASPPVPSAPETLVLLVSPEPEKVTAPSAEPAAARTDTTIPVRIPEACPPPKFPAAQPSLRVGARVLVRALVRDDGSVADVKVLETNRPHAGFEEAAVEAVRRWRFVPGTQGGAPVEASTDLWIDFQ